MNEKPARELPARKLHDFFLAKIVPLASRLEPVGPALAYLADRGLSFRVAMPPSGEPRSAVQLRSLAAGSAATFDRELARLVSFPALLYHDCWSFLGRMQRGTSYLAKQSGSVLKRIYELEFARSPEKRISRCCGNESCVSPFHMLQAGDVRSAVVPFLGRFTISDSECWEWDGKLLEGYGGISITGGEHFLAHRFSYALFFGTLKIELVVRHRCDNRRCVNPLHLELGTRADNRHDAVIRGRIPALGGEKNPRALLTNKQADAILRSQADAATLAEQHRVPENVVRRIRSGETFRSVWEGRLNSLTKERIRAVNLDDDAAARLFGIPLKAVVLIRESGSNNR